jgi:hypothetical protein
VADEQRGGPQRREQDPFRARDSAPAEPRGHQPGPALGPAPHGDRERRREGQLGHRRGRLPEEVVLGDEEHARQPGAGEAEGVRGAEGRGEGERRDDGARRPRRGEPERGGPGVEEREPGAVPRVEEPHRIGERRAQVRVVGPLIVDRQRRGEEGDRHEAQGRRREARPLARRERAGDPERERRGGDREDRE